MSAPIPATIGDEARLWAIRADDPEFADWDGLTAWLEADPRHLEAYERAIADNDWAVTQLSAEREEAHAVVTADPVIGSRSNQGSTFRQAGARLWRGPWSGAIAASLLMTVAIGGWYALRPSTQRDVATAPGERRTIDFADGSQILLNGGTHVRFDQAAPREVALVSGEALFTVHHEDARPFVVSIGDSRLIDVGTVFNVARDGGRLDVAVAQGSVVYRGGQDDIRLNAGEGLSQAAPGEVIVLHKADRADVGAWRTGVLTYTDANLSQVGHDLARNLGLRLDVDAGVANLRFSGTLAITGDPAVVLMRIQPLLRVSIIRQGNHWRMVSAHAPAI